MIEGRPGGLRGLDNANSLAHETSPYLLQHAANPVHWHPWGESAFKKARDEDKPIFLSIGYSACHWCHVMARESFEDEATAALLNEHFVSIKVDREERPDLDQVYMAAVQALTGGGGWPMSVFLTTEGHPFYGGTYFPPIPRFNTPSFAQVLRAIADAWRNRRPELERGGRRLVEAIERQAAGGSDVRPLPLGRETLDSAFRDLQRRFDRAHGGWGGAPKFPQPMILEFLLRHHHGTGDAGALAMVTKTLEAMARGGMYDQIGGGFHRYSMDDHWSVPHFERMLYDNAQLARVYLHAWQATGNGFFRVIAEEVLDYVKRELTCPDGGFASAQDADSEGEEGRFFIWTRSEIRDLSGEDAEAFIRAYGVTSGGNFEGRNILRFAGDMKDRAAMAVTRRNLFEAREKRIHPGRDEKVLTSWNGLMLAAFAEAARALDREDYRSAAEHNADFLLGALRTRDGRLFHTWTAGRAKHNGFLEDYSFLIEGLLELYQTTFERRWYRAARELAEIMLARFPSPGGGFFDTGDDHETLIVRPRSRQDNATPSGDALAAAVLLKLAGLAVEPNYVDLVREPLARMQPLMARFPLAFGQRLQVLSYALAPPMEIAIVGDPVSPDTQALLSVVRDGYRPFHVLALGMPGPDGPPVPLLRDRGLVNGRAAAYVCREFTCRAPVTEPEALRKQLDE